MPPAASAGYRTVSFLSDFGLVDEFVAVVKSVIWSISPDVRIVDVSHDIPRYNVRAGGLTLARAAQYLNPGVVLAVIDPGVGGSRRAVAVEIGEGESVLLGPDNGLLAPTVGLLGGARRVVELSNEDYRLSTPGSTFDGRDVFAPAAGHLAAGAPLDDLGPSVSPDSLCPGLFPAPRFVEGSIEAEVLWVDHFGNVQLNVSPADLDQLGGRVILRFSNGVRTARRVMSYSNLDATEVGLLEDSYGLLAIAQFKRSAADELGLAESAAVTIEPATPAAASSPAGAPSPAGAVQSVKLPVRRSAASSSDQA